MNINNVYFGIVLMLYTTAQLRLQDKKAHENIDMSYTERRYSQVVDGKAFRQERPNRVQIRVQ